MKPSRALTLALVVLGALLVLTSCTGNIAVPSSQRVTFALVLDTRAYNGIAVIADVLDDFGGTILEVVTDALTSYPNTANHAWARLTTLEEHPTNRRYVLDFYLDMDGSGTRSFGDLHGMQHFDVMPNAVWSETKYYSDDLETVP
ncbi:hypothetical protein ACFLS5_04845 [Candidatus Bipolaricaulota bacterium]